MSNRGSLSQDIKDKIALFCNVKPSAVLECLTCPSIYMVPQALKEQGILETVAQHFKLSLNEIESSFLTDYVARMRTLEDEVLIAMVGKYTELQDAYMSVSEALKHAGVKHSTNVRIEFVDSEDWSPEDLRRVGGILVPGGFGTRGIEGKIKMIKFARENNIPFLGICLGMQCAVIEYARNVCGINNANTKEVDDNCMNAVIDIMADQKSQDNKGGTMRLGAYPCKIRQGTHTHEVYEGEDEVFERHRHRRR